MGDALRKGLTELKESYEDYIEDIRGMGLMLGLVLREDSPLGKKSEGPVSLTAVKRLHDHGLLTIPSGTQVIRLLPALNIQEAEVSMTLSIIQKALKNI
jgi:acetylornithine aminotransferase